jgi:hypothetical protein
MKWKEMVGTKERERTQNFFTIVTSKEFNWEKVVLNLKVLH